jgi:hypothetical protein
MAQAAAAASNPSSLSSYLYQQEPNKYGGKQEEYLAHSEKTIGQGVQAMKEWPSGKNPTELFHKVLTSFRGARAMIAIKHQTTEARSFGKLRTPKESPPFQIMYTPLNGPYKEYNRIFIEQLSPFIRTLVPDKKTFSETRASHQETRLGCTVSFQVDLLSEDDIAEKKWDVLLVPHPGNVEDVAFAKELQRDTPAVYERIVMSHVYLKFLEIHPYVKHLQPTHYALGTLSLEIGGKVHPTSRFFTWLFEDGDGRDPVDIMKENASAVIIHQDPLLIDDTLTAVAELFKQAILWNPKTDTKQELKNRVALFRYAYAHCTPCHRGDGAIGDWLELALYRYHGFTDTRFTQDKLACFETLTALSLSHYLDRYDSIITVAKPDEAAPAAAAAAAAPISAEIKDDK